MQFSTEFTKLVGALIGAQSQFKKATKSEDNQFKSKYANLEEVIDATRPALILNGLAVLQSPATDLEHGSVILTTRIVHSSGEWMESVLIVPGINDKGNLTAQSIGAATTYARRTAWKALLGVAEEDDDGNSGGIHKPAVKAEQKVEQKAEAKAKLLDTQIQKYERKIVNVVEKPNRKGENTLTITLDDEAGGSITCWCFDKDLFNIVKSEKGQVALLTIKPGQYPQLIDIQPHGAGGYDEKDMFIKEDEIPF